MNVQFLYLLHNWTYHARILLRYFEISRCRVNMISHYASQKFKRLQVGWERLPSNGINTMLSEKFCIDCCGMHRSIIMHKLKNNHIFWAIFYKIDVLRKNVLIISKLHHLPPPFFSKHTGANLSSIKRAPKHLAISYPDAADGTSAFVLYVKNSRILTICNLFEHLLRCAGQLLRHIGTSSDYRYKMPHQSNKSKVSHQISNNMVFIPWKSIRFGIIWEQDLQRTNRHCILFTVAHFELHSLQLPTLKCSSIVQGMKFSKFHEKCTHISPASLFLVS